MALSELRLLYIAQNSDTALPFVSLENDARMMICDSNDTPAVMMQREKEAGAKQVHSSFFPGHSYREN